MMHAELVRRLIALALEEDLGSGDVTSEALIDSSRIGKAHFLAKQNFILCGVDVVKEVFAALDSAVMVSISESDGTEIHSGRRFGSISGPLRSILSGERTALNFLQRLSGVATKTAEITRLLAGTQTKLLDTRKTTPGWRALEKYAVKVGGGVNHRFGLFDAFLIKNNHLDALAGDIPKAVRMCREYATDSSLTIEVEVRNFTELEATILANVDRVLLDNMSPDEVRRAVQFVREKVSSRRCEIEASGGITESTIRSYAEAGVDFISVGAVTHSVAAVDISLRVES